MNEEKICPMMSFQKERYNWIECTKKCAWYDHKNDNCGIFSIINHMGLITEVCDGSRTLFVREC